MPCHLVLSVVLLVSIPALAATDAAAVRMAVEQFLTGYRDDFLTRNPSASRVEFTVTALDPRLTLAACAEPLTVSALEQNQLRSRFNVQVGCPSGNGWSIYVPVEMALFRPVVVASRPLGRGEVLTEDDLTSAELDITRLHGTYLTEMAAAIGQEVRRPLAAQSVITQQALQPPLLIRRGEAVSIRASGSAIAVRMTGTALTDGRLGQSIRVRNSSSNRVVDARVVGPGETEVAM
jgi:flagella basal body P-ring formation protein FlgA